MNNPAFFIIIIMFGVCIALSGCAGNKSKDYNNGYWDGVSASSEQCVKYMDKYPKDCSTAKFFFKGCMEVNSMKKSYGEWVNDKH